MPPRRAPHLWLCAALAALPACGRRPADPAPPAIARAGAELVGTPAQEFIAITWPDGQPHTLAELRGRVVLVRFWTDTCPYCRRTAPALRQLDAEFAARGLVVVGLHHPKPRGTPRSAAEVEASARAWGMDFRVGLDATWATLDAWWLADHDREATSASFLIDRRGTIRLVHPGPEYTPTGGPQSRRDFAEIHAKIVELLAELPAEPP